jgi:secreted trypsin-like serine protease
MLVCGTLAAIAGLATAAAPSQAIVGGQNASPGEWPAVAAISFGGFSCTGTLIAPNVVLTAGHCSSTTGAVGVGTPVTWPAALITVRIGGTNYGEGERVPVSSVVAHPNYKTDSGSDISLLMLSKNSTKTPVKVAGAADTGLWAPGTMEWIVGWGHTSYGGSSPDVLQEAQVPIVTDADCKKAYREFNPTTMICAGFPQGGVDSCQGDSGGPMFGGSGTGLRVVGATSFGHECARAGYPGVYARVGDTTLREWIRGKAPAGVA